ncbi:MAG: DUF5686 and carboxypeptidase regulatory-like domain-containing protein [Bacteroidales bacterium]|nr:DUF5686 and carboxypeptidase regulatory-like domain-containing protein [Bacteroidales bacterium]
MKRISLLIVFLFLAVLTGAQPTRVKGVVLDAQTGEPMPYVSIIFPGTRIGTMSDEKGAFSLEASRAYSNVSFQMLGYETYILNIKPGATTQDVKVKMNPDTYGIQSVIVKPKRRRDRVYRRRGNPAVELVQNVIAHKWENHVQANDGYRVEDYEKLAMALDRFDVDFDSSRFWRKMDFLRKYVDTTQFKGSPVLTVSLREKIGQSWFQKDPKRKRSYVERRRNLGLEEALDNGGLGTNIQAIFADSDIFEDNMELLLNRFVSPLSSSLATTYYKYYITDTLKVDGVDCIDLTFVPFNSESYSFTGHLYIVNDSTYAVKKYSLGIPAHINLNFVSNLAIEENFEKMENGTWASTEKNTYARFYIFKWMRQLYAHKQLVHWNYDFTETHIPDSLLSQPDEVIYNYYSWKPDEWWVPRRPIALTEKESILDSLLRDIYSVPWLRRTANIVESLASEYFPTTPIDRMADPQDRLKSKFDIGPVTNMLHYNQLEGLRMRVGGMTTARFNPQNFLSGYLAFGTKDKRFKYNATYVHSFSPKSLHPYEPLRNNLIFSAEYDLEAPGQSFELLDRDNIMMSSFGPQPLQYVRRFQARYEREWLSRLSLNTFVRADRVWPAGTLAYQRLLPDGSLQRVDCFNDYSMMMRLRYAPGEPLFSSRLGKESPITLAKDAPIVTLSHTFGYFDNRFWYNKTEFSAQKRIWLSAFGHIDASVKSGFIWNKVPLPKLFAPNANPSILLLGDAYNLMRPMEFVMDQYAEVFATYYLKGWILNRIPLINRLKLREVVSFRAITGSLSEKNNPLFGSEGLYLLPEGMKMMTSKPYMEYSIGLENIFKFLRVDYIRRISYTEGLSEAEKHGFKISFRVSL